MMNGTASYDTVQGFLLDAQVLLTQAQECLQHLELIANDADACQCLNHVVATLARRADSLGLPEIAHYASVLHQLLAPACQQRRLNNGALPILNACLILLAWQLELVDRRTGRLALENGEQSSLLSELAEALDQPLPQTCAACAEQGQLCAHSSGTTHPDLVTDVATWIGKNNR